MSILPVDRVIVNALHAISIPIDLYISQKKLNEGMEKMKTLLTDLQKDLDIFTCDLKTNEGWKSDDEMKLMELVYNIEDFAVSLCTIKASDRILSAIGMDPLQSHIRRIESFQKDVNRFEKAKQNGTKSEQGGGSTSTADATSSSNPTSSSAAGGYTPEEELVGISEPKKVLLDLLEKTEASRDQVGVQDAKQGPKVISIVGCPGVGKTALARIFYDHYCVKDTACNNFNCVAWVETSGCSDGTALLGKILKEVQADLEKRGGATQKTLQENEAWCKVTKRIQSKGDDDTARPLREILADKRYLVFIDDVQQAQMLEDTLRGFPENDKRNMLIVTTSVHSVANVCSSLFIKNKNVWSSHPGSYVYTMQRLQPTESEKLFWKHVFPRESHPPGPLSALSIGSKGILSKCDGLPLALISVAEHLRKTYGYHLDRSDCERVGKQLCSQFLAGVKAEHDFRKLRKALGQCFEGLADYDHKIYMLSLSIFPRNHPIKSKSLVRRLMAEGFFPGTTQLIDDGKYYLTELINQCIVDPVEICSWSKDGTSCRVCGGIMLEFIIHKCELTNFVTLIREEEVVHNQHGRIRRLSVQSRNKHDVDNVQEEQLTKTIRSLTIVLPSEESGQTSRLSLCKKEETRGFFACLASWLLWQKKKSEVFIKIKDCMFMRVLDLEGCEGVDNNFFGEICQLVYLKYLSLRNTDFQKIPKEIENLQYLQTLDMRQTSEIIKLPKQVIKLSKLAFLFGKFELPKMTSGTKEFLKTKSVLHTFAGFLVDGSKGYKILEARKLRKIKIWCADTQDCRKNDFIQFLQKCFTSLNSVSINFNHLNQDNLPSLEGECNTVKCMKIWGKLGSLPFMKSFRDLKNLSKLQLSNTGLGINELSSLQHIPRLEYLKLQDEEEGTWDGDFTIKKDGFQSLRRLCFQASKLPNLEFQVGSMKLLNSLQLLCPDNSRFQGVEEISRNILHITSLNEVILHHSAAIEGWETVAKNNANRPCVKRHQHQ